MKISRVAIIGAGSAGLNCGRILSKNEIAVTIFDKGRMAGGRVASRDRDENCFDYGAQYFAARDEKFRQFLAPFVRAGKVARWNAKFISAALHPHPLLQDQAFMPCIALLLTFADGIKVGFDGIKLDDPIISWVALDASKPGRPHGQRWIIHVSPNWSKENYHREDSEIEEMLLSRFATIFDITLPNIIFQKVHKWRFALPIAPLELGCIFDSEASIAFCGDWCIGAKVEGAFLSGLAAAEKILAYP